MRRRTAERQYGARCRLLCRQSSVRFDAADHAAARGSRRRRALARLVRGYRRDWLGKASMGHSILVTGGAGYLGSILVPELLAAGHRVTVLDNFMYDQNSLAHVCANPNFDVVNGDARSSGTPQAAGRQGRLCLSARRAGRRAAVQEGSDRRRPPPIAMPSPR